MTQAAQEFITPLSAGAIAGERAYLDLFDARTEFDIGHIRLARDTDVVVVAPATADLIAKMAGGHADDLATTVLLATDKPVLIAPAMNPRMWMHAATKRNFAQLAADGIAAVGPNSGEMAEQGEAGAGRMAEPLEIVAAVETLLGRRHAGPLAGRHVLVTAGPTHEPIDPVRYIANRSSGKQGYAIARAAAAAGAAVTLVAGPVAIPDPPGVKVIKVESAREMLAAAEAALPADAAVFAAAVADWRVAEAGAQKIKKAAAGAPQLALVENPDILATIAQAEIEAAAARHRLCCGDRAGDRECPRQARAQGLRLDRRQRRDARDRHHGGRPQHGASHHRRRRRVLARRGEGRGGGAAGRAHRHGARGIMTAPQVRLRRLPHGAGLPLPAYQSAHAAGLDLAAAVPQDASVTLAPGTRGLIPTGFAIALPAGFEAQVRPRSGLAAHDGVTVLNTPGTIDADYRGEIQVILINLGSEPFIVTRGMRIAQLVVAPVARAGVTEVGTLDDTPRGTGGFGSTGG